MEPFDFDPGKFDAADRTGFFLADDYLLSSAKPITITGWRRQALRQILAMPNNDTFKATLVETRAPAYPAEDNFEVTARAYSIGLKATSEIRVTQFVGGALTMAFDFGNSHNLVTFCHDRETKQDAVILTSRAKKDGVWGWERATNVIAGDAKPDRIVKLIKETAQEVMACVQDVLSPPTMELLELASSRGFVEIDDRKDIIKIVGKDADKVCRAFKINLGKDKRVTLSSTATGYIVEARSGDGGSVAKLVASVNEETRISRFEKGEFTETSVNADEKVSWTPNPGTRITSKQNLHAACEVRARAGAILKIINRRKEVVNLQPR